MQFFDAITALAISGILGIIALYIIVVYKKGWLKTNNSFEDCFLCPNPDCRKPFSKPVLLTDLSITPPKSYPACPHCSITLRNISFFSVKKKPSVESIKVLPSLKEPKKPTEKTQPIKEQTMPEKPTEIKEVSKPAFPPVMSNGLRKAALQELKLSVRPIAVRDKKPSISIKPDLPQEMKDHSSSQQCPHFFGYVRSLPKNDPIPDECLGCPWIVQCLVHAEKVEAKVKA